MLDLSLGILADVGGYDGPLVNGRPLHSGHCEDTTHGCRKCGDGAWNLTDRELESIGWPTTKECEWCKKAFPFREVRNLRPWDEPSICYEVCNGCRAKHNRELEEEFNDDR